MIVFKKKIIMGRFITYIFLLLIKHVDFNTEEKKIDLQKELSHLKYTLTEQKITIEEQNLRIAEQDRKIVSQFNKLQKLDNALMGCEVLISGGQGTYFKRWGRKDCPANITDLVYTGYVGGSHFRQSGGAAEYTCMPSNPIWGENKDLVSSYSANMFGAEYEGDPFYFGMKDTCEDVPCAVCQSTSHSMTLMIPGRAECYPGWTKAYAGNLASGYPYHKAPSQYICLDEAPQSTDGGRSKDDNGKLLYPVCVKCGAMPCPPYEEGKYLSCVVCMK